MPWHVLLGAQFNTSSMIGMVAPAGLAISLIFGIFDSTLLTLVVIPVLYYASFRPKEAVTEPTGTANDPNPEGSDQGESS